MSSALCRIIDIATFVFDQRKNQLKYCSCPQNELLFCWNHFWSVLSQSWVRDEIKKSDTLNEKSTDDQKCYRWAFPVV